MRPLGVDHPSVMVCTLRPACNAAEEVVEGRPGMCTSGSTTTAWGPPSPGAAATLARRAAGECGRHRCRTAGAAPGRRASVEHVPMWACYPWDMVGGATMNRYTLLPLCTRRSRTRSRALRSVTIRSRKSSTNSLLML